ncbi:helix-turn-helix transcriptional regulator [Phenylobacterium sp.]|uniref:helix-turn-helix domain-containing protein n=1 Tax=Phenylobacterium sp. TaxID=1871053 RepID=UPI002B889BB5|nr:helix-turn-helix transcriptional regulator [Phenylobacterium sp.]HVI33747.1 helix-turn-helix transcriptional regulator [Phenylobacterium sp.]
MPKSVFSGAHRHVVDALVEGRRRSGLTQAQVAERIGRDQSFISLIENAQRRVDVLEFFALCRAMDVDAIALLKQIEAKLPGDLRI